MTEQRLVLIAAAMVGCLLGVSKAAQVTVAHTSCTDGTGFGGACGSGVAHSSSTGPNGVTEGECAYTNAQGQSIKIKYQQFPDGRVDAQANNPEVDALVEFDRCRKAVVAGQVVAQENFDQIQVQHQQLQDQLQRQQQQLQEQILRQQQAIFNQRNFPVPIGFNPLQFPNFHQAGFGANF